MKEGLPDHVAEEQGSGPRVEGDPPEAETAAAGSWMKSGDDYGAAAAIPVSDFNNFLRTAAAHLEEGPKKTEQQVTLEWWPHGEEGHPGWAMQVCWYVWKEGGRVHYEALTPYDPEWFDETGLPRNGSVPA